MRALGLKIYPDDTRFWKWYDYCIRPSNFSWIENVQEITSSMISERSRPSRSSIHQYSNNIDYRNSMQTLHSLTRDLPNVSSANTTSEPPVPSRRFSLSSRQLTLPTRNNIRKPFLFAQHPDQGPAVESLNPQEPPLKRCELALDESLYLPKTDDQNFYGRFITLGYHHTAGPLSDPLRSRSDRNKTFELWKRVKPNGWKFVVDANSGLRATTVLDSNTRERLRVMSLNTPVQQRSSSIRVTSWHATALTLQRSMLPTGLSAPSRSATATCPAASSSRSAGTGMSRSRCPAGASRSWSATWPGTGCARPSPWAGCVPPSTPWPCSSSRPPSRCSSSTSSCTPWASANRTSPPARTPCTTR